MTAHKPESVCSRKIFLMKKTSRGGGASGEPHEAVKTQISPHPGHGIPRNTDRKTGYRMTERTVRGRGETAFPHSRFGEPA